jgi:hypothetical protein
MEPKTELQKKVVALSAKLPPISEKQKAHAFSSCLVSYVAKSRKTFYCLECGHSWKEDNAGILLLNIDKRYKCPSCQRTLKYAEYMKGTFRDSAYYSIVTTQDDMQVVRMFLVTKDMKKGLLPETWIDEVMQHWINEKGKVTTMSKTVQGLSRYYDQWIFHSNLEVRPQSYRSSLRYSIEPYRTYPGKRILPIIRRNGFTGHFHGMSPLDLLTLILKSPAAETLLKSKQIAMLKHYTKSIHMNENWPSIKICIRNGYIIKDASMWEDYISLLRFFRKDLHSPKYVCPVDLKKAHDRLVLKKRDLDRKQKIAEMRKRLDKEQVAYARNKGKFFGLVFSKGNIQVKTIESVEEIMVEGDKLNHCVFANEYHKKADSLILSARIKDEPVETIELSLKRMEVLQARGSHNSHSKYHKQILELVNSNIGEIRKRITA